MTPLAPQLAAPFVVVRRRLVAIALVLGGVTLAAPGAGAAEGSAATAEGAEAGGGAGDGVGSETATVVGAGVDDRAMGAAERWRGSGVSYRNVVSALTFDEGAEVTYNPYYAMSVDLALRFWPVDGVFVHAGVGVQSELTESDITTFAGESLWSDLTVGVGAPAAFMFPVVDIALGVGLDLGLPTSKVSQARTLQVALIPYLSLSRRFDVLSGLSLGYGLRVTKGFHEFSTATRETPLIPGCALAPGGCGEYENTGLRNVNVRLSNRFSAGIDFIDELGLSASFAFLTSFLYPLRADDPRVSLVPQAPTDTRHALAYGIELTARPTAGVGVALGMSTVNPQLAPDSSRYAAFFNRYTTFYLDLRLDLASLVGAALAEN